MKELFERYNRLKRYKRYINDNYPDNIKFRFKILKRIIRQMENTRKEIENEIYLFPKEYRHIP